MDMIIRCEDPGQADVVPLLEDGEAHSAELYPAESNHHISLAALRAPEVRFFVGRDETTLERFRLEARAASSLSHPGICTVFDIGDDGGSPFIVMEALKGEAFPTWARPAGGNAPPEADSTTTLIQTLEPGTYAWSHPDLLVLPVATLVIVIVPYIFRMTRASMAEAL